MVVADATIANYGEVKITINDEKEYTVEGGTAPAADIVGGTDLYPFRVRRPGGPAACVK